MLPIRPEVPTFAVIGAVNHGKSSVVSTLSEDDSIRVSSMPGETVDAKRFRLRDLLVFYDTPGFQNARKTLAEITKEPPSEDPLQRFRNFVDRHRSDPLFDAECRLLEPVLVGAGIIYVVDGSLPLTDMHRREMELIRLTGAPRLAVVNCTSEQPQHVQTWLAALAQTFNAVREFNAHRASFEDRKDLLEALANIERGWKPKLQEAINALEAERSVRIDDAATLYVRLIAECLTYSIRQKEKDADEAGRTSAAKALVVKFKADLAGMEATAHDKVIELYRHHLVHAPGKDQLRFEHELFSEQTWSLFGLDSRQLVVSGAVAGATVGGSLDVVTAGHTLLLGSVIGAAVGGASAYLLGKKQPEVGGSLLRLSNKERVVGPIKDLNFPWILLDRALCTLVVAASRTHARRDKEQVELDKMLPWLNARELLVTHWPADDRKRCERVFAVIRKKGAQTPVGGMAELSTVLREHFARAVAATSAVSSLAGD